MRTEPDRKGREIPYSECRDLFKEISEADDRLQDSQKKARSAADALSAASFAADVQVDLIASSFELLTQVNVLALQLLEEECSLRERVRRLKCIIRMTKKIQDTILRAIDVYLACFGGKNAIAIQAMVEWIKRRRAGAPADAGQTEIDQILRFIVERADK